MGTPGQVGHLAHPVEHGAAHAIVRKRLKADPSARVIAALRLEKASKTKRHQVFEIAGQRELTPEPARETEDHLPVLHDQLLT
jgi:hypothetical protein